MQYVQKHLKSGKNMWNHILNSNVRGVLLDLDDTLYAYTPCHKKALSMWIIKVSQDLKISLEQAEQEYNNAQQWINLQLCGQGAGHSRLLYSQIVSEKYGLNIEHVLNWQKVYWDTFIENMQIFSQLMSFLEACKKKDIGICLISDMTTEIQLRKLQKLQVGHFFNYIVTSEESSQEKPKLLSFLLALHKLNMTTEQVIMIGDSQKKDIDGAEILGIKSYPPFFI